MSIESELKDEQDNHQLSDELYSFDNEKELSNNIAQNTEINNFNIKIQRVRQKKPKIIKFKKIKKKIPKKIKAKKPEIKKQRIDKKPKSKKSYKNILKSKKENLNTDSRELCTIGGEHNILSNNLSQKVYFYHEDHKKIDIEDNDSKLGIGPISKELGENVCMGINKKKKVRFLEKGGIELVEKYIEPENKNENTGKNLKKNCNDESWLPKNSRMKEILSNPKELEKAYVNTKKKLDDNILKEENLISDYGLETIEENNANEANMKPLIVEESNLNDLENESVESFNYLDNPDDLDNLIPPSDENINFSLINSLYNQN